MTTTLAGKIDERAATEAVLRDQQEEEQSARSDAELDNSNLAELEQIKAQAEAEKREPQRSSPGFFSRIISFFSFSSKYKSGKMSDKEKKRRSDDHYENFLIAKLSYQNKGESDYDQEGESLTFSDSGENIQNDYKNDSAAISETRSKGGQELRAATNVTYGGRLRFQNTSAIFKHRILGDSTALYSSSMVQLKLLGEFRDLILDGQEKMEILHNYTDGTDKFGAIASAKFDDEPDGVTVDTGKFFIRDGNKMPSIAFARSFITLSGSNFTVRLKNPRLVEGKNIISSVNTLSSGGSDENALAGEIALTDDGIILPDDATPGARLVRGKDNKLTVGTLLMDADGNTQLLTTEGTEKQETAGNESGEDIGETLTIGSVTFTGVKKKLSWTAGLNVDFTAKHATVKDVDHLSFSDITASFSTVKLIPDRATIEKADIEISGMTCLDEMKANVTMLNITEEDGITFDQIKAASRKISVADVLSVASADILLTKKAGAPLTITASVSDFNASAKAGLLSLEAEKLSGLVDYTGDDMKVEFTSGSLTIGIGGVSLGLEELAYREKQLSFGGVSISAEKVDFLNILELSDLSVSHSNGGSLSSSGLEINDGTTSLSADIALFGNDIGEAALDIEKTGYLGTLDLGSEDKTLINSSFVELSAHGKLIFKNESNTPDLSAEGFGASVLLGGAVSLSADDIHGSDGKLTAATMSGGIVGKADDGTQEDLLSITADNVSIGKDGYSFDKLTSKYSGFELFGGLLSFDAGTISAGKSEDLTFSGRITSHLNASEFSAGLTADLSFRKADHYRPTLDKIDSFSLATDAFTLDEGQFTGNKDGSTSFTAKEISFGKNQEVSVSDLSGSASEDGISIASANATISGFRDMNDISASITNLSVNGDGVFFDDVTIQKKLELGNVLSAENASVSVSKPRNKDISVTIAAEDLESEIGFDPLNISTTDLGVEIKYSEGKISGKTTGDITASLGSIFEITASDLGYENGIISFGSVSAKVLTEEFAGGSIKLGGLSAEATGIAFNKEGLIKSETSALNISADSITVLGTEFGKLSATLDKDGFAFTSDVSVGDEETELFPNVMASLTGSVTVTYSKNGGFDANVSDVGASISIFENKLTASGINKTNSALTIEKLNGEFKLPGFDNEENIAIEGSNISIGDGFKFGSLGGKLNKKMTFFNNMLYINDAGVTLKENLESIEVEGTVGFNSKAVSAKASATVSLSKEDKWKLSLGKLTGMSLEIPKVGKVGVESILPEDNRLVISDITAKVAYKPEGKNLSIMQDFLKNVEGLTVTLEKAYYENGKFTPDMDTLKLSMEEIPIKITDDLTGTLNIKERKLSMNYSFSLPKKAAEEIKAAGEDGKDHLPKLASLGVEWPILPPFINATGSIFAGACAVGDISLTAKLAKNEGIDAADEKIPTSDFLLEGKASLQTANAGAGVEIGVDFGIPNIASVSAGIRGALIAQAGGTSLEAGLGIHYNRSNKKLTLDRFNKENYFNYDVNAGLKAKLSAFVHGKLFAIVDRDLVNITVADVNLGSVHFCGKASLEKDGWKVEGKQFEVQSDLSKLMLENRAVVFEKEAGARLGEIEKTINDPENSVLFAGKLGEQEAMERSAQLQVNVIPILAELRTIQMNSNKYMQALDKNYHKKTDDLWNRVEATRVSIAAANDIIDDISKAASPDPSKTDDPTKTSAVKVAQAFYQGKKAKTIIQGSTTPINANMTPQDIKGHFLQRAGFHPPVAILAALSKTFEYNQFRKDNEMASVMLKYVGVRQAINRVYNNPIQPGSNSHGFEDFEVTRYQLENTARCHTRGSMMILKDFMKEISSSEKEFKKLNDLNKDYVKLIDEFKKYTDVMDNPNSSEDKKKAIEEPMEKARKAKEDKEKEVRKTRAEIVKGGHITNRETAVNALVDSHEVLAFQRKELQEARDVYHRKSGAGGINYYSSDITKFMDDFSEQEPDVKYNLKPMKKYSSETLENTPVDLNTFRLHAWRLLAKNTDENEQLYFKYLNNATERSTKSEDKNYVRGEISNQMMKMMYSAGAYAKVTGSTKERVVSDERDSFTHEAIRQAADEVLNNMIDTAKDKDSSIIKLEELIEKTNARYVEAERLNNKLTRIGVGDFNNRLVDSPTSSAKIVQAPEYKNAMKTLAESATQLDAHGDLSMDAINVLRTDSEQI